MYYFFLSKENRGIKESRNTAKLFLFFFILMQIVIDYIFQLIKCSLRLYNNNM